MAALANVRLEMGAHAEAKALYERSLGIRERVQGRDHPHVAYSLNGLGRIAMAEHRWGDAIALFERALEIRERGEQPASDRAVSRFALARALWESNRDRTRALELARSALDAYGPDDGDRREEIEAWLAARADAPVRPPTK